MQDVKDDQTKVDNYRSDITTQSNLYTYYVKVAATTPTYAWIWPVGTIAAATVAGIYGKKATDCLDAIDDDKSKIAELLPKISALQLDITFFTVQTDTLTSLSGVLKAFIPVLQKIEGIWKAIADDLRNILNDNITIDKLKSFKIKACTNQWNTLKGEVDTFRTTAYIKVQSA